jgi:peptidoglycan L-alanyl-D-glutamate endopeptidase CwlK
MKPSSEQRLQKIHPALASAVRAMIADLSAKGLIVEVVQGMRTFAEQDELYAKGRTKPGEIVTQARGGESNHNYGLAVDVCPFTNDKPDWNAPLSAWAAIGAAAEKHGLEWGGQWKKFIDKPHVQLPAMTVKECARCHAGGGMDAVWTTASERIGWTGVPREASGRAVRRRRRKAVKRRKTTAAMRRRKTAKKTPRRAR